VTESGFVRVSSNRLPIPTATTPAAAIEVLTQLRAAEGHEFWIDDVSVAASKEVPRRRLGGFRQVTGAHLVALARRRRGTLATFDRGVADLLPQTGRAVVVLLDTR
jgi:predicted nucleic acid-binding protein